MRNNTNQAGYRLSLSFVVVLLCAGCFEPQHFDDVPARHAEKTSNLEDVKKLVTTLGGASTQKAMELAKHSDSRVRRRAAQRIGVLGISAPEAIPTLAILATEDQDPRVRTAAVRGLGKSSSHVGTQALVKALCDSHHSVNTYARKSIKAVLGSSPAAILEALPPNSEASRTPCRKPLERPHSLRQEVMDVLGSIQAGAIPVLREGLSHNNPDVVAASISLIGQQGNLAVAALEELSMIVFNSKEQTRLAAIDAITRIGDLHPTVIPTLYTARQDSSEKVSEAAAKAIETLRKTARRPADKNRRGKRGRQGRPVPAHRRTR